MDGTPSSDTAPLDSRRRETKSQRAPWPPQEQDQACGNRSEDEEDDDSDGVLPLGAACRGEKEHGAQPKRLAEQGSAETVKPIGRFRCPWSVKRRSNHVAMMTRSGWEHRLQWPRDSYRMASRAFRPGPLTDHRNRRRCEPEHDTG
jgi:hypothetical protein